jgi:hypothetical protein
MIMQTYKDSFIIFFPHIYLGYLDVEKRSVDGQQERRLVHGEDHSWRILLFTGLLVDPLYISEMKVQNRRKGCGNSIVGHR